MASALDLITSSLRLAGVVASGETPTADEANDAIGVLNDMLSAWALQNLMCYRNDNQQFNLVGGQQSYTIGPAANFATDRPVAIEGSFVTYGGLDFPLRPLTTDEWNSIALKSFSASIPNSLYYVPTHPQGVIWLWPAPSLAIPITLSVSMQFSALTSLAQSISYPPGYAKALRYCLAVELSLEFGREPSPLMVGIATQELGNIKAANAQSPSMVFDRALTGGASVSIAAFFGGY